MSWQEEWVTAERAWVFCL